MINRRRSLERRTVGLAVVVALQLLATIFFLADVASDIRADGLGPHLAAEAEGRGLRVPQGR